MTEKIKAPGNRIGALLAAKKGEAEMVGEIYLAALSRPPEAGEAKAALAHVAKASDKRTAWEDVLWAVLNTREFLFRH